MYFVSRFRHRTALLLALFALYLFLPRTAEAGESRKPQFRLGTSSIHLGWSSAAANLDSDDKIDFAIADRTGRSPEGYNYRLQLALSHEESQIFHFHSTDSALNLSIVDLDNDADLDVVLTHALSGEIAGVWLNNGRGGFREGNTADFGGMQVKVGGRVAVASESIPPAMGSLPLRKTLTMLTGPIRLDIPIGAALGSLRDFTGLGTGRLSDHSIASRAPPVNRLT
jgi:hypothetical protein